MTGFLTSIKNYWYDIFVRNCWANLGWAALGAYTGFAKIDGWSLFTLFVITAYITSAARQEAIRDTRKEYEETK